MSQDLDCFRPEPMWRRFHVGTSWACVLNLTTLLNVHQNFARWLLTFSCHFPTKENQKFDISHHGLQMRWRFFVKMPTKLSSKSPDTHTHTNHISSIQRMYTIYLNAMQVYYIIYQGFYVTAHVKWCNVIHPFSHSHHQIYFYKELHQENSQPPQDFCHARAVPRAALLPAMAVKLDLKNIIFWHKKENVIEPQQKPSYFPLNPGCLIGILTMVYYNPQYNWVVQSVL